MSGLGETATKALVFSRKRSRASSGLEASTEGGSSTQERPSEPEAGTSLLRASKPRLKPGAARAPQLTQTYIDLGQRGFFAAKCAVCGLLYSKGNEADDKLHAAFHAKALTGPRLQGWQAKVVLEDSARGQVLMAASSASNSKRLDDLRTFLESQMGLVPGWLLSVPTTTFLYVTSAQHVAGCVVVESIKEACAAIAPEAERGEARPSASSSLPMRTGLARSSGGEVGGPADRVQRAATAAAAAARQGQPSISGGRGGLEPRLQGAVLLNRAQHVRAVCGVRLIWVSVKARRAGLATKLLDCMRCHFMQGYVLPRQQLAFTQPTEQGMAFIRSYTGTNQFLIYG